MGWSPFSWFRKRDENADDYERVLADLALSIQSKQTRLSEIRLRERRASLVVTLYAIGGWLLYVALWWTVLPRVQLWRYYSQDDKTLQSILKAIPAVVGPILILFVRRLVQMWYTRKGDQEEKQLKSLMAEQRTKIEEIKKKTNYYSTKNLLERYDDSPLRNKPNGAQAGPSTPVPKQTLRHRNGPAQPPQTPQQQQHSKPAALALSPAPAPHYLQATPQRPMQPPQRQWYDKLADALLGADEPASPAHSRYALICENCFAHNGLVRESEWDDMKYVCPKCGYFNASPKMKREGRSGSMSPPPITPGTATSLPNSPEPYRSRFEAQRSKLGIISEPPTQDEADTSAEQMDVSVEVEGKEPEEQTSPMKVD